MAGSSVINGMNLPVVRSISLPSRLLPNPIEAELGELKSCGLFSASPPIQADGETICTGLTRLAKLHKNIEEIIQSPLTRQVLQHPKNLKLVEEGLDDSVGLLDACGNARDLILMMEEQVQDLQSALRRRGGLGDSSSIESNILAYISFRKNLRKIIAKSLKKVKRLEGRDNAGTLPLIFDVDCHLLTVVKAMRESNAMTLFMFRTLLCFLAMPAMKTKGGGWSLIRKMIPGAVEPRQKLFNEVGIVDFTLSTLQKNEAKTAQVQVIMRRLESVSDSMKGVEAGLDRLFRCLIRYSVSLLNVITPASAL